MSGWLKLHRSIFENAVVAKKPFCRGFAWAWLLAQAAHTPVKIEVKGKVIELQRGQLCHSVRFIANAWGWDRSAVDRYLTRLKTETMIETETETGQSIITICNYSTFQDEPDYTETAVETAVETGARQQRDSSETKTKNDKNDKNEKKVGPRKRGTRLPESWVLPKTWGTWALEQGLSENEIRFEAEKFRDHWTSATSKATKLDWLATWRNWIRRRIEDKAKFRKPQASEPDDIVQRVLAGGGR